MTGRVMDWQDMVGKTVKAVIDNPIDELFQVVIGFDDGSFACIHAEDHGYSCESDVWVSVDQYPDAQYLSEVAHPLNLFEAGLINQGQYEYLTKERDDKQKALKQRKADALRRELEQLEGQS